MLIFVRFLLALWILGAVLTVLIFVKGEDKDGNKAITTPTGWVGLGVTGIFLFFAVTNWIDISKCVSSSNKD